ncbi:MAG: class I SAM-dependent methyltransferase [Cyclobacteriaceae bacterium]|nr:class I SAM-dependent methyltransferase [Cyclobacteriaceae bacterium SS2]
MDQEKKNYNNIFGDIDLELLDLILKGFFSEHQKLLDIGCGEGRNLIYFLQNDFDIYAIDIDRSSVDLVRYMVKSFGKDPTKIIQHDIRDPLSDMSPMDAVICSRVLHFCEDENSFLKAWQNISHLLGPGGLLYLSMDSIIGFSDYVKKLSDRKIQFSDGSVRFPLTEDLLEEMNISDSYEKLTPVKTIHYEDKHAQTILCLRKK